MTAPPKKTFLSSSLLPLSSVVMHHRAGLFILHPTLKFSPDPLCQLGWSEQFSRLTGAHAFALSFLTLEIARPFFHLVTFFCRLPSESRLELEREEGEREEEAFPFLFLSFRFSLSLSRTRSGKPAAPRLRELG